MSHRFKTGESSNLNDEMRTKKFMNFKKIYEQILVSFKVCSNLVGFAMNDYFEYLFVQMKIDLKLVA